MEQRLRLTCISYILNTDQAEGFYFLELTTLEVSTLLDEKSKISNCEIFAYSPDKVQDPDSWLNIITIEDFNRFFVNNADFYIHDAKLTFADGSELSSHDDGEVHIRFGSTILTSSIVSRILHIKGLPSELEQEARKYPNYYLSFDTYGRVMGRYSTFEAYLKSLI